MKKLLIYFILTLYSYGQLSYTNALIHEKSLYLRQHAHNPVNWLPWGEEALKKAKREKKLIFLSLGYSTCHWCHVMKRKTFDDVEVGKLLNDDFVSIKVDREEYPQLNRRFQRIFKVAKKKKGGWPLSVFMSPDGDIISMTTYIPKYEGYGSVGMVNMLPTLLVLQKDTKRLHKKIKFYHDIEDNMTKNVILTNPISKSITDDVMQKLMLEFDKKNGGFSQRKKYPEVSKLELLFDIASLDNNEVAFNMFHRTLNKMAKGGIYDQIGGGFFRYTLDNQWQIPHFEKMLYTNAGLIQLYVKLYKRTHNPLYKKIVDETISQMGKIFLHDGFYLSATDSDSGGEEGGYFIFEYAVVKKSLLKKGWKLQEVEEVLAYLGIEEDGNIDGDFSHPHITSSIIPKYLEETKAYLKEVSSKREYPFIDKKIITAWNAMMVKALFLAGELDSKYHLFAKARLDSLLGLMYQNSVLYHQTYEGTKPTQKAILEDYAYLIDTLIEAYIRTHEHKYLALSEALTKQALQFFYRDKKWYLSNDGIEALADFTDRYYASGLSVMLDNLIRLASLSYKLEYLDIVKYTIKTTGAILEKNPTKASKLVHLYLRLLKGDMTIKATRSQLLKVQKEIQQIHYPFMLVGVDKIDKYIACKVTSCFAEDVNITQLIKKIDKKEEE